MTNSGFFASWIRVAVFIVVAMVWVERAGAIAVASPTRQTAVVGADTLLSKPANKLSPAEQAAASGFKALVQNDLLTAGSMFEDALRRKPDLTVAMLGLADVRVRQRNTTQAEVNIRKALATEPANPDVHTAAGRLYMAMQKYPQAKAAYLKAIELDPQAVLARLDLADLYASVEKNPKAAIAEYRKALEIKPDLASARMGLGMTLLATGDTKGAISELQEAVKRAPEDAAAWHLLGRVYASDKRYPYAVKALSQSLVLQPDTLAVVLDRGDVYNEMGEDARAASDYALASRLNPRDPISRVKLGMVMQRLGDTARAEAAYRDALRLKPDLAIACNNLAMISLRKGGNLDEALALSKRAVAASPNVPQFHDTQGWVHRARGERTLAVEALQKAVKLPPPQAEIWYHLGIVLEESGRKQDAVAAYRKALSIDGQFAEAADASSRAAKLTK
jgi:tetratricopeptide (TPR) repeat protein